LPGKDSQLPYLATGSGSGNYLILPTNEMKSVNGLFLYDIMNNRICNASNENALILGKDKNNRIWIRRSHKLFILDPIDLSKGKISLMPPVAGYAIAKDYSVVNMM